MSSNFIKAVSFVIALTTGSGAYAQHTREAHSTANSVKKASKPTTLTKNEKAKPNKLTDIERRAISNICSDEGFVDFFNTMNAVEAGQVNCKNEAFSAGNKLYQQCIDTLKRAFESGALSINEAKFKEVFKKP